MRLILAVFFTFSFALAGCSVNPVTGEKNFILPHLDENWERKVGAQMYAPMRQSQGGDYKLDLELTKYVTSVGDRLAAHASRPLAYEFHVLNDSVPNAWALPGGKIVVNRGLLTELNSEAELAAVLGHEIVHADAAHGARQQSRGMLTQVGVMAAMIYGSRKAETQVGQQIAVLVPQLGAQLITTKYGRDAERESDLYGMRYMSTAGYDTQGAVDLQETFVRLTRDRRSNWLSGLLASHPASTERVANNRATAKTLPTGGEVGRDVFRRKTSKLRKMKPAYEAHDKARKALTEKKVKQARKLVAQAIRMEPREAIFHTLSGDIHIANKSPRKAERAYSDALRRDSSFFYPHLRRGQARYELNKFKAARVDLQRSLELLPTEQANLLLGNLDKSVGNMQSAIKYYRAAAQSNSLVSQTAKREVAIFELPGNPGKYIQTGPVLGQDGNVSAVVRNNALIAVKNIRLKVEYIDASGQLHQMPQTIRKALGARQQTSIITRITASIADTNELARRVRITVISADVAEN